MADHLVELYGRDKSSQAARRVLTAWDILGPSDGKAQRTLVNGVLLPLAKTAVTEHFDVALEYATLLKGIPQDRRDAVRKALRTSAASLGRHKDLERRLERVGLRKPGGLFGKGSKRDV